MDQIARSPKQVGDALRRGRRQAGISQTTLAAKADLRQATISGIEHGEPGTALKTICDVLIALDLELVIRPRSKGNPDDLQDLY